MARRMLWDPGVQELQRNELGRVHGGESLHQVLDAYHGDSDEIRRGWQVGRGTWAAG